MISSRNNGAKTDTTDCYLRQGGGGIFLKFARIGFPKLVFRCNFIIALKRISARSLKNALKLQKNIVELKNKIL